MITQIILGVLGFILLIGIFSAIRIIRPMERGLVERFGKYNRLKDPGLAFMLPFGIEQMYKVNITEMLVEAEPQEIITEDKLNAMVDAQVYFKVKSDEQGIKASQYNVYNYQKQIVQLTKTTLRNIIGNMTLNATNSKRNEINSSLKETLTKETESWGIDIVRAELKEISPPKDVQFTMNKVVVAENEKRAAVDFATSKETEADGFKRAEIKKAEGIAKSIELQANAKANAIKVVNEAAEKYFLEKAQKLRAFEAMEVSMKDNAKIIVTKDGISPNLFIGNLFNEGGK